MYNLVVDIGNTNGKLAVFNGSELVQFQSQPQLTVSFVQEIIERFNVENSSLSSVVPEAASAELVDLLRTRTNYVEFSTGESAGVRNAYKSASSLGLDRWAKVIAAYHGYSGKDCFIIDAGTCITYDFIPADGLYRGGSISPGLNMRFKALKHFTGRLPLVEWEGEDVIPEGNDTVSAISNGVLAGLVHEVKGFIADQIKIYPGLTVLLTGGDSVFLLGQLKNSIFAPQIIQDPYLVLKGLNEVIVFKYVQKN